MQNSFPTAHKYTFARSSYLSKNCKLHLYMMLALSSLYHHTLDLGIEILGIHRMQTFCQQSRFPDSNHHYPNCKLLYCIHPRYHKFRLLSFLDAGLNIPHTLNTHQANFPMIHNHYCQHLYKERSPQVMYMDGRDTLTHVELSNLHNIDLLGILTSHLHTAHL